MSERAHDIYTIVFLRQRGHMIYVLLAVVYLERSVSFQVSFSDNVSSKNVQ